MAVKRIGASLRFDPERREDQLTFVGSRADILATSGDEVWAVVTPQQAETFREEGIDVRLHEEAYLVDLPAALFDPLEGEGPQPPPELSADPQPGVAAYHLVQFTAPPDPAWVAALEELGAEYVGDVPHLAALFRMTPEQAGRALDLAGVVRWVGIHHPVYALDYRLAGRDEPFSAAELASARPDPSQFVQGGLVKVQVSIFHDMTTDDVLPLAEEAGATVEIDTGYSLIVTTDPERLSRLVQVPGVRAVEPYLEPRLWNMRAGAIIAANQVRNFGNVNFHVNLDGAGEIVGVLDSGLHAGANAPLHPDFNVKGETAGRVAGDTASRVISVSNINTRTPPPTPPGQPPPPPPTPITSADHAPHGTHVTGSIAGNGQVAETAKTPTVPRGIAPAARIVFHSVNVSVRVGGPPDNTVTNDTEFARFIRAWTAAYEAGARVHNNSWGNTSPNSYTFGTSEVIDAFAFTHPDMLILFAAGNEEADANSDGVVDMNFLGEQPVCKNIVCVGACENETTLEGWPLNYRAGFPGFNHSDFNLTAGVGGPAATNFTTSDSADDVAFFSDRGRVTVPGAPGTGRVRPDLVAPGTNVISTRPPAAPTFLLERAIANWQLAASAPAASYYVSLGTSMATPMASGAALLVRQFYRDRLSGLRRPLLVEALTNPLTFVDAPAAASHEAGCVLAWVRPVAVPRRNDVVGAILNRRLARAGDIKELLIDVGDHPAVSAARHGDSTLLVHRGRDGKVHLSRFDKNLAAVGSFGTAGGVTLAPESRPEDDRRPALCVHSDEVAVAWVSKDTDELLFQRFNALTGKPIDTKPKALGKATNTSPHPYLVYTGDRYAAVWVRSDAGKYELLLRTVDDAGAVAGEKPVELVAAQPLELREAQLVWDSRRRQYLVAWVEVIAPKKCRLLVLRTLNDGTTVSTPTAVGEPPPKEPAPARKDIRRPRAAAHPDKGFVLFWEDDTQVNDPTLDSKLDPYDLYLTFLDRDGKPDDRIPLNRLQISDTPAGTFGFSALVDAGGVTPVWQSNDEINSDLLGVYTLNVTREGSFEAQLDPNTPLLQNGRYTAHLLQEYPDPTLSHVALAWAGGEQYMLRLAPTKTNGVVAVELVRTNADGKPPSQGATRTLHQAPNYRAVSLHWTGRQLIAAFSTALSSHVLLLDGDGRDVTTGSPAAPVRLDLNETPTPDIFIQTGQTGEGAAARYYVAYGQSAGPGSHRLRYAVMAGDGTTAGAGTVAPRDLTGGGGAAVLADGTARHGWFHVLQTDAPVHFIAAWHLRQGANNNFSVLLNRFRLDGRPQTGIANPLPLTTLAGDSKNAVIAPRPALFNLSPPTPGNATQRSRQREFGVAWQNRSAADRLWEIFFSRLERTGRVQTTRDVRVVTRPADSKTKGEHCTDPQLVWHTDGYGLAWLQQDADTGGPRRLFFTAIDQNGARVVLPPPHGVAGAAAPVGDLQISADDADVQAFQLVWNGRTFRVTWTEVVDGKLRHRQTGLVVPRVPGSPPKPKATVKPKPGAPQPAAPAPATPTPAAPFDEPFKQPSAALVRATLINGATNIRNTSLPNVGPLPQDGYGWGRINLRQSLAPTPPVTFHARDDAAVERGRTARYEFELPPKTALLRVTLAWTDPPRRTIVNDLNLRVTAPAAGQNVYVGNRWQTGPLVGTPPTGGPAFSDPLPNTPAPGTNPFDRTYNVEQVVIANPPPGTYLVEVIGGAFLQSMFMLHPGQPFALVFVGSGPEIRTAKRLVVVTQPAGPIPIY